MAIVAPQGELDLRSVPPLVATVDAALAESPLILAIDLRGVTFLDGGTVGTLVSIGRRCEAEGRRLLLVHEGPQIDRVLSACGLDGHFDVVSGLDRIPGDEPTGILGFESA
jgi:anti-anti-sigma factor